MQYMVVGADGNEYGPASVDTLKQWAIENRLQATTKLRDFHTGQMLDASAVSGIFPSQASAAATATATMAPPPTGQNWTQPPSVSNYRREPLKGTMGGGFVGEDTGAKDVWVAIIRAVLALVLFFALGGLGIIVASYGLYYGIRAQASGHKLGWLALVISILAFLAVGIGWMFRLGII